MVKAVKTDDWSNIEDVTVDILAPPELLALND
jgi:hypothetical protein